MKRLVVDRSDTRRSTLIGVHSPSKPLNWFELLNDDYQSVPFLKDALENGFVRFEFKPIHKLSDQGIIVAHKPDGFQWIIGFYKFS